MLTSPSPMPTCFVRERLEKGHLKRNTPTQNRVKLILEDGSTYPSRLAAVSRRFSGPTTGSMTLRLVFPNPISPSPRHSCGPWWRRAERTGPACAAAGITRDRKGIPVAWVVARTKGRTANCPTGPGNGDKCSLPAAGCRRPVIVEGLQKVRPAFSPGPAFLSFRRGATGSAEGQPLRKPVRRWKPVMSKFFLTDRSCLVIAIAMMSAATCHLQLADSLYPPIAPPRSRSGGLSGAQRRQ